jgi:hypothetical protein
LFQDHVVPGSLCWALVGKLRRSNSLRQQGATWISHSGKALMN